MTIRDVSSRTSSPRDASRRNPLTRAGSLAVAAAIAVALSGCAGAPSYTADAAADLQSRVLAVSEAAASADYAAVITRLDELRAAADSALAKGEITAERHASILSSAQLVQADSEQAAAEAEVARVAAEQEAAAAAQAAAELERSAAEAADKAAEDAKDNDDKGKKDKGDDD